MRDFEVVRLFLKVAQTRNLSAAGRALGIPRSSVSRRLSELEADIGARLMQRSTRSFGLTDAGLLVLAEFQKIADATAAIEESLKGEDPKGLLRVTAPSSFARHMISPTLPDFFARYPRIALSLDISNRKADVIGEEFDVAIRAGHIESSGLLGRRLGGSKHVICASPQYIASRGPVNSPGDLEKLSVLAFHPSLAQPKTWTLLQGDRKVTVQYEPRLATNDHSIILEAAIDGLGVACLPERLAVAALKDGLLQQCLSDWDAGAADIFALYPSRRSLSPKVRVFIEHLAAALNFSI